ncbi:hypothetical protein D9M68_835820 [compost metagenome]
MNALGQAGGVAVDQRGVAQAVHQVIGMEVPAQGAKNIQQATGDDGGQALDGVEPAGGERALLRGHAIGGQHQQRQHCHRLAEHLQQVERVEVATDPLAG